MKKIHYYLLILIVGSLSFTSCLKDSCDETTTFVQITPRFVTLEDIRAVPQREAARELRAPGKMYFYNNTIFVNELKEGIHIIDNANPESPQNIGFITIPGNVDIAAKDGFLYADSYMDLVTLDIRDLDNITQTCREENIFQGQFGIQDERGVLVDYVETENFVELDCSDINVDSGIFNRGEEIFVDVAFDGAIGIPAGPQGAAGDAAGGAGIGGSLARISIAKDHLYAIDQFNLYVYDLERADKPQNVNEQTIEWGIETLFPYNDFLFIGANNGMFIYDNENPESPRFLSKFEHARACDPVFVQGTTAFVTLRDGTACESFNNQLDVVDVSDVLNPTLLHTHQMDNPHGLSVRGDHLYICEGEWGMKVFDKTDLARIPDNRKEHLEDIHAFDVISLSEDHILIIGDDGLYQYDSSDKDDLELMSKITVNREF
jgi:hypothetical protein